MHFWCFTQEAKRARNAPAPIKTSSVAQQAPPERNNLKKVKAKSFRSFIIIQKETPTTPGWTPKTIPWDGKKMYLMQADSATLSSGWWHLFVCWCWTSCGSEPRSGSPGHQQNFKRNNLDVLLRIVLYHGIPPNDQVSNIIFNIWFIVEKRAHTFRRSHLNKQEFRRIVQYHSIALKKQTYRRIIWGFHEWEYPKMVGL